MIDPVEFKRWVVEPVLRFLGMHSLSAERLVVGTAAVESGLSHLVQLGGGPALGVYQIEPETHRDIWDTYLAYRPELASKVRSLASQHWFDDDPDRELICNLSYSTAICRLKYYRIKAPLPDANDIQGLANYWKQYYNTKRGKGRVDDFYMKFPDEIMVQ